MRLKRPKKRAPLGLWRVCWYRQPCPIVIQATAGLGGVILAESTLSFLGLGPGVSVSWGALLDQGSSVLLRFPHVALISGACIATTVLAFHLSGDALRDRLDPRAR